MTPDEQAAAEAAAEANTTDTTTTTDDKVTFDDKQQARVNKILQDRLARQKTTMEADFTAKLQAEIQKVREELTVQNDDSSKISDLRQKAEELQRRLEAEKQTAATVKAENARILKNSAMDAAMGDLFVNNEAVMALTDNQALGITVELDKESGAYIVREKGAIKMNSSMEPMTLQEFYADYAAKNPYLAAGDTRQGTNSTTSRSTSATKPTVKSKADLKTPKAKHAYIREFGIDAFERLGRE